MTILLLLGCPPKAPELPPAPDDPAELLAFAQREELPGPTAGLFDVTIETSNGQVNAQGTLVVAPPDRFRVELRGPIGGPALVVACDGTTLAAWQGGKGIFYDGAEVASTLRTLTGGPGVEMLAPVLLGRAPPLGPPTRLVLDRYTWEGPEGRRLELSLDPRSGRLRTLNALDGDGGTWLSVAVEPGVFPEILDITLPGARAVLSFSKWVPATPDPSAFTLTPPEGAEIRPIGPGLQPKASSLQPQ